jgi:2-C-methyl-D-erythritol 4-phosphate cytidylyltransferase / 2-C-methyl-D-erythritol 2,4-cyclodiphosphate synthase
LKTAALIVAAGQGTRAGGPIPKQYAPVGGRPVLAWTIAAFQEHPAVHLVQVVIAAPDAKAYAAAVSGLGPKLLPAVNGGSTRQASVRAGLLALASHQPDQVLIHDAVRAFVSADTISRVLARLADSAAAVAAVALTDTLKRSGPDGLVVETLDRANLWRAQTPQAFRFADIRAAHDAAAGAGHAATDDAAIAEWAGLAVTLVPDSAENTKITTAEDLAMAERRVAAAARDVRTGSGFDVHRLVAGDHVWLCGVRIPHSQGLEGHSDADVALHALTDALLGCIGDGDIGVHFPDSDPRWKGAASHIFLAEAGRRVREAGGRISNVDVTLLCEAPRIGPYREAMRARVAAILGIEISRVGVKATTTEGLGFLGRKEGIAALAGATVVLGCPAGGT